MPAAPLSSRGVSCGGLGALSSKDMPWWAPGSTVSDQEMIQNVLETLYLIVGLRLIGDLEFVARDREIWTDLHEKRKKNE